MVIALFSSAKKAVSVFVANQGNPFYSFFIPLIFLKL